MSDLAEVREINQSTTTEMSVLAQVDESSHDLMARGENGELLRREDDIQQLIDDTAWVFSQDDLALELNQKSAKVPFVENTIVVKQQDDSILVLGRDDADAGQKRKVRTLTAFIRESGKTVQTRYLGRNLYRDFKAVSESSSQTSDSSSDVFKLYVSLLRKTIGLNATDVHITLIQELAYTYYRVNGDVVFIDKPRSAEAYREMCNHIYNFRPTGGDGEWSPSKKCNALDQLEIDGVPTQWRFHSYPNEDRHHCDIVIRRNRIKPPKPFDDISEWYGYDEERFIAEILKLGYMPQQAEQLIRMFRSPYGSIFMAGETNSGKTTSLETFLTGACAISNFQRILITIQDQIELTVPRSIRTPVFSDSDSSMTYADAIESALRRDANIIGIGEIRTADSGPSVVQATLSGHLVAATIHANNLLSMIDRLEGLDVPRDFLAGSGNLAGLMWQTLLPTLCNACKEPIEPTSALSQRLLARYPALDLARIFVRGSHSHHCSECHGKTPGQTVAAEIMHFPSPSMRTAIRMRDEEALLSQWQALFDKHNFPVGPRAMDHAVWHAQQGRVSPADIEANIGYFDREDL